MRHLEGTNRALNTQTIYRRAALGLVAFREQDGELPGPRQLTRRHLKAYRIQTARGPAEAVNGRSHQTA